MRSVQVSVVIPAFGRANMLRASLSSVLAQKNVGAHLHEIIVVDDASPDPITISSLMEKPDARVKIVRHQKNGGAAKARNTGIAESTGDYIAFLDSDDLWLPGKLEAQLARVSEAETNNSGAIVVAGGFVISGRVKGGLEQRIPIEGRSVSDFVSGCWFCPGSTLLAPRDVFNMVGAFDTHLKRLEDLDWFIRFGHMGGQVLVCSAADTLIAPSHHANVTAVSLAAEQLVEKYGSEKSPAGLVSADFRRLRAYLYLERAAAYIGAGQKVRGAALLAASFALSPRLHLTLKPFWQIDRNSISPKIAAIFGQMQERANGDAVLDQT